MFHSWEDNYASLFQASFRSIPKERELQIHAWGECLINPQAPLVERYRALMCLRYSEEPLAADMISNFLVNVTEPSPIANALLQHEAAHCLGQRKTPDAVACLINLVRDSRHEPVVRHEAAESLSVLCELPGVNVAEIEELLQEYVDSPVLELSETCQVAVGLLSWFREYPSLLARQTLAKKHFPHTRDPAPAFSRKTRITIAELRGLMMNPTKDLFTRFQALFTLRDYFLEAQADSKCLKEIASALSDGLKAPKSPLLRHEVGFVLHKLIIPSTAPSLAECVRLKSEHSIVRHEAAAALGHILQKIRQKGPVVSSREPDPLMLIIISALESCLDDEDPLVRDSCALALNLPNYVVTK